MQGAWTWAARWSHKRWCPRGTLLRGPLEEAPRLTSTEAPTPLQFPLSLPPRRPPSLPGVFRTPSFGPLIILSSPAGQACLDSKEVGASTA